MEWRRRERRRGRIPLKRAGFPELSAPPPPPFGAFTAVSADRSAVSSVSSVCVDEATEPPPVRRSSVVALPDGANDDASTPIRCNTVVGTTPARNDRIQNTLLSLVSAKSTLRR